MAVITNIYITKLLNMLMMMTTMFDDVDAVTVTVAGVISISISHGVDDSFDCRLTNRYARLSYDNY